MVKLIVKDYKSTKAQKAHTCNKCRMEIKKGTFYRKHNDTITPTRLHEHCFKGLSLESAKKNLEDL